MLKIHELSGNLQMFFPLFPLKLHLLAASHQGSSPRFVSVGQTPSFSRSTRGRTSEKSSFSKLSLPKIQAKKQQHQATTLIGKKKMGESVYSARFWQENRSPRSFCKTLRKTLSLPILLHLDLPNLQTKLCHVANTAVLGANP